MHLANPRTTLYVTHDQEEALVMSDRVAVMRAGRIVQIGPAAELYARPANTFVARFLGESNLVEGPILARGGKPGRDRGAGSRTADRGSRPPRPSPRGGAGAALIRPRTCPPHRGRTSGPDRRTRVPGRDRRREARARRRPRTLVEAVQFAGSDRRGDPGRLGSGRRLDPAPDVMTRGRTIMLTRRHALALGAALPLAGLAERARAAAGQADHLAPWGRGAERSREDDAARPVREGRKGSTSSAPRRRTTPSSRRWCSPGRPNGISSMSAGRFNLAGRRVPRTARHVADPERQGAGSGLGRPRRASSPRPARPSSPGTPRLSRRTRGRHPGRISGTSRRSRGRAGSTSRSITITRRRCWPPARRMRTSIRSPRRR